MAHGRFRVEIDGDPYLLRSAVFEHLRGDPRFDVALVGIADEPRAVPAATAVLTVAADGPLNLQRLQDGISWRIPYDGLQLLADALVRTLSDALSLSTPTKETHHA